MESRDKRVVQIRLNEEQKEQVRRETGKQADAIELSVQELEERIAPISLGGPVRAQ